MAVQWGENSLQPGQSAGWYFVRPNPPVDIAGPSPNPPEGPLPVLQVRPILPSRSPGGWALTTGGYPYWNQLGISTIWSQVTDDGRHLVYFIVVQNNSGNGLVYTFLEADL
jgi:hypothetical protein